MEPVPPYLVLYLWKIRKGSGKPGYLKRRFEDVGLERSTYEKAMLREALDLHLIGLSEQEDEVVFDPLVEEVEPGVIVHRTGTEHRVSVPNTFVMLARGHWLWTEWVASSGKWLLTAVLGALIALAIAG